MAIDPGFFDDYIARLKLDLEHHRAELKKWESGAQQVRRRAENGTWEDLTPQWIASDKAAIAVYEGLIEKYEAAGLGKIPVYGAKPVKDT